MKLRLTAVILLLPLPVTGICRRGNVAIGEPSQEQAGGTGDEENLVCRCL